jgi:hypothetical protein
VQSNNDLFLLLGKLDGKLDVIQTILISIQQRADTHESRILQLERWRAEHAGMEKRTAVLGSAFKVLLGAFIPVAVWGLNYLLV